MSKIATGVMKFDRPRTVEVTVAESAGNSDIGSDIEYRISDGEKIPGERWVDLSPGVGLRNKRQSVENVSCLRVVLN